MAHAVYILHSKKLDRFYTGETADFDSRKVFHDNALSHKFTAKGKDWNLFLRFECKSKDQALAVESHIKRMKSSTYIRNLRKYPKMVEKLLQKYAS